MKFFKGSGFTKIMAIIACSFLLSFSFMFYEGDPAGAWCTGECLGGCFIDGFEYQACEVEDNCFCSCIGWTPGEGDPIVTEFECEVQ